jgi:hypothetical protein
VAFQHQGVALGQDLFDEGAGEAGILRPGGRGEEEGG